MRPAPMVLADLMCCQRRECLVPVAYCLEAYYQSNWRNFKRLTCNKCREGEQVRRRWATGGALPVHLRPGNVEEGEGDAE